MCLEIGGGINAPEHLSPFHCFFTAFYPRRPNLLQALAGAVAAVASATVGVPFECLKHRLQLCAPAYATPWLALMTTLRTEGVSGLFSGFGATLARNVPYNFFHFGLFALAARCLSALHLAGGARDAIAGALAGATTALLTTPMDLVNTRLQTQAVRSSAQSDHLPLYPKEASAAEPYKGFVDALTRIVREEGGAGALLQGARFRVPQYAASALVFFYVYEFIKRAGPSAFLWSLPGGRRPI